MSETAGIAKGFNSFFKRNRHLLLCFFVPAIILFVSYAFFGVYPFGKNSVLSLDLNAQYVYYYDYMYDVIAGKESLFYSWSRTLSGEMMGIIGYYVASPFMLSMYLFPREMITEGLLTIMVAKAGMTGLCFGLFLDKSRHTGRLTTIIISSSYALCSYFITQTMNPMWLDGVMILPIIALAIENLCKKGKFGLLVFALSYGFITNFYIGYMLGIFSAIYFVYYIFAIQTYEDKPFSERAIKAGIFGISAISAILISMFMILPVVKSLSLGKFEFSDPDYTVTENFNIINTFGKLLPNSYDTVRMEGLPFIYTGTTVLVLAICYFAHKKISARERIGSGILLGLMLVFMYIRPVDMFWHGGQMPNWLPYRYSFMISFLLATFAAEAFERLETLKNKVIALSTVGIIGVALYFESLNLEKLDGIEVILPAIGIVAFTGIFLYVLKKDYHNGSIAVALAVFVGVELFFNTITSLDKADRDIVYSTRPSYTDIILPTREVVTEVYNRDESFFRMEKTFHRAVNDPMALRMYGMSHSSSTLNAKAIMLLQELGYTSRSHFSRYDGATPVTDDIFGVKYVLNKGEKLLLPTWYEKQFSLSDLRELGELEEDITVYENDDAMPFAYLGTDEISDVLLMLNPTNPFTNQNDILSALCGERFDVFVPTEYPEQTEKNINKSRTTDDHDGFKKDKSSNDSYIDFKITAKQTGPLYMYISTKYERKVKVYSDKLDAFALDNSHIAYLGDLERGETVEIRLKLEEEELYAEKFYFYSLDKNMLKTATAALHEKNANTTVTRVSGSDLEITCESADGDLLFTTIPYEEGWTAYVDGKKAELSEVLGGLLAVEIPAGNHKIELKFFPAGLKTGLVLTLSGLILLAAMLAAQWLRLKGKELSADLPEGFSEEIVQGDESAETAQTEENNIIADKADENADDFDDNNDSIDGGEK